jgi:hypothetical protein
MQPYDENSKHSKLFIEIFATVGTKPINSNNETSKFILKPRAPSTCEELLRRININPQLKFKI